MSSAVKDITKFLLDNNLGSNPIKVLGHITDKFGPDTKIDDVMKALDIAQRILVIEGQDLDEQLEALLSKDK